MKMTKQKKYELQKMLEEELKKVPLGEKVSLDTELLEELLFEKVILDKKTGLMVKFPFWSGEFLRKLDLSKVNFEDVSFGEPYIPQNVISEDARRKLDLTTIQYYDGETIVDYSYTNANIDLSKLFGAKFGVLTLSECNLKGVNLKDQDLTNIRIVYLVQSDVSNTGLIIPSNIVLQAYESNLSNIDLSNREIDGNIYISQEVFPYHNLADCCLLNTGININFSEEKYLKSHEERYKSYCIEKEKQNSYSRFLMEMYNKHQKRYENAFTKNWVGCFVNGEKINSNEYVEEQSKIENSNADNQQLLLNIKNNIEKKARTQKVKVYIKKNNQD